MHGGSAQSLDPPYETNLAEAPWAPILTFTSPNTRRIRRSPSTNCGSASSAPGGTTRSCGCRRSPCGANSPAPGARHASIEDALEASAEEGTRSILDLDHVADEPDFGAVTPLDDEFLEELYGTTRPTRDQVMDLEFLEEVERGHGVLITIYRDGRPDEYMFAGYSYD